eukprot:15478060-Alexandrium_andersonii.AAC.1
MPAPDEKKSRSPRRSADDTGEAEVEKVEDERRQYTPEEWEYWRRTQGQWNGVMETEFATHDSR